MSFTTDVKKNIISRGLGEVNGAKKNIPANIAGLSAFVRTSGELGVLQGQPSFFLVSETENVAEFFMQRFAETFAGELSVTHATRDKKRGRAKLVLQCPPAICTEVLSKLRLLKADKLTFRLGICKRMTATQNAKIAYIQGAFLGGGSCTLPSENGSGYHLEIVFSDEKTANDFCDLLMEEEIIAKTVQRKEDYVVYLKSKELISDFLSVIGAETALKKFNAFVEKRDSANHDNRARNCFSGNADKTAIAAVKQVVAIQKLKEKTNFAELSEELKTLAKTRLERPQMSLKELAEYLDVSKSCLNHRLRKLIELSNELD